MSSVMAPGVLARLLRAYRAADPLNLYIGITSAGIVWVALLSRLAYHNPLEDDRTSMWDTISFSFITKWNRRFPVGGKTLMVADLADDTRGKMTGYRNRFTANWRKSGGRMAGALKRNMLRWWIFTHVLLLPRKIVEFLPAFLVEQLLLFLQTADAPRSIGYKLTAVAALRMLLEKSSIAQYLFSQNNAGVQPTFLGAQAAIYEKLQTMSPRARVCVTAAEVQTLFAKMDEGKWKWIDGAAKILLDVSTLPLGYAILWKDFGLTAVVCSIATTIGLTALTARAATLHAAAEQRVRELRKKQEGQLNELAASLPIWKLCEHTPSRQLRWQAICLGAGA